MNKFIITNDSYTRDILKKMNFIQIESKECYVFINNEDNIKKMNFATDKKLKYTTTNKLFF